MTRVYEIHTAETEAQAANQHLRDDSSSLPSALGEFQFEAGNPVVESKENSNEILALSGLHGGFTFSNRWTHLAGVPGTVFNEHCTIKDYAVIEGARFESTGNESNRKKLVTLEASAKVIFRNCVFQRLKDDPTGVFVEIKSGAKAIFTNCVFKSETGPMSAGSVVSNAGGATDVYVGIGFNMTTRAHVNVTAIVPELS